MSLTLNRADSPVRTVVYISINACNNTMYMSLLAQCKPSRYFDTGSQLPRRHPSVLPAETRWLCACPQMCVHQCTCKCVCVRACLSVHTVCVCLKSLFMVQYAINTLNIARSHCNVNTCSTLMHYACLHLCLTFTV